MTVREVGELMESRLAPLDAQESYDNAGLQAGDPAAEVTGILVCLDVSEAVIDEAVEKGCNLIVSHHPLLFRGIKSLVGKNAVERCLIKSIQRGIAVYSAHTNADSVWKGVSGRMCEQLGLKPLGFLQPSSVPTEGWATGLGMTGEFDAPLSEQDFLGLVKRCFRCDILRHTALTGRSVKRVALCGGAGSDLLEAAVAAGADAFLTADVRYHEFIQADGRLLFVDAGHYETEQYTKELFAGFLSENISTFAVRISEREVCPVRYF